MNIAIFHLGFFYSGGGEKLVLEEIRGLRKLGHTVDCYAPFVDREQCFPDFPEIAEIKALLPAPPSWLPMKDPLWVLLSCLLVPLQVARFAKYDVFLGANQPGPWIAFVLSRILGKPYVIYLAQALRILHPREVDLENGIRIREGDARFISALQRVGGRFVDWADRKSISSASVVLTNGEHVADWINRVYSVETITCPAGCHPSPTEDLVYVDRWRGSTLIKDFEIRKPYILLTNRHSPMKRFEYALWAMKAIVRDREDVRLVITGQETEYTEQLRYLAAGLGIQRHVQFVGLVPENDLTNLYSDAALYVYPSPEEDFGMGVIEAMALGTPVVAWRNGGPTVTVKHGETGYLVAPYDTEEFAACMFALLESPELAEKLGRAGNLRARSLFSYDRHNRILESHLQAARDGSLSRHVGAEANSPIPIHSNDLQRTHDISGWRQLSGILEIDHHTGSSNQDPAIEHVEPIWKE